MSAESTANLFEYINILKKKIIKRSGNFYFTISYDSVLGFFVSIVIDKEKIELRDRGFKSIHMQVLPSRHD